MTVRFRIEGLCCANCGAKIEKKLGEHPAVQEAVLTFATNRLQITAEDPVALLPELIAIAREIEPEVTFLPMEDRSGEEHDCCCHGEHGHCDCGHEHGHHDRGGCTCGHDCGHHDHGSHDHGHSERDIWFLLAGAALFAVGLLTSGRISVAAFALGLLILGWEVMKNAALGLFRGRVMDENFLMTVASVGAFFIGNAAEGVGVMLFYRVGEFFEHKAVERSRKQIMEAVDMRPETVTLAADLRQIPAKDAVPGDVVLVRPGDRIPLDGVVLSGESRVDTAPVTGESIPVAVRPGSEVISGCVNMGGQLTVRVEKPLETSMVTRILNSVEKAAAGKPRIDRFITRFARVYTPIVVAAAVLTATVPSLITGEWSYWVYTALSFLVMSCPCALVLSVPLAFFAGIGAGSRRGILFKDGAAMEALGKVRAVVMDKTGTLTKGDFRIRQIRGDVLAVCAACEELSTHPIAQSITAEARERGLSWKRPESLREIPGRGIEAVLEGRQVLVGSRKLLEEQGIGFPEPEEDYGTWVFVAVDGAYAGAVHICDTVKPDAASAMEKLHGRGYSTVMLTGDGAAEAEAVARELKLDRCYAALLPHEKLERLQAVRQEKGAVLFVGDGINDAPVLAGADVGAAMGSGADAAIEAADVVFMTSKSEAIPEALSLARRTARIAWQNVIFALGIKLLVMLLGLLGHADMWLAVFADSGVAMLCVLNSIRMLYKKK